MMTPLLEPFAEMPMHPHIAALPKADIHIHQEWSPRLDRVLAQKAGREPYNWREWAVHLMKAEPPGQACLRHLSSHFPATLEADAHPLRSGGTPCRARGTRCSTRGSTWSFGSKKVVNGSCTVTSGTV